MAKFKVNRKFEHGVTKVWNAFDDFGGIYKFHPFVEKSFSLGSQKSGLGAERECQFVDGNAVQERIIKYVEGKEMTIEIFDTGRLPINSARAIIDVGAATDGSEVVFEMEFQPRFGPLGWLMGELIMKRKFRGLINDLLDELNEFLGKAKQHANRPPTLAVA